MSQAFDIFQSLAEKALSDTSLVRRRTEQDSTLQAAQASPGGLNTFQTLASAALAPPRIDGPGSGLPPGLGGGQTGPLIDPNTRAPFNPDLPPDRNLAQQAVASLGRETINFPGTIASAGAVLAGQAERITGRTQLGGFVRRSAAEMVEGGEALISDMSLQATPAAPFSASSIVQGVFGAIPQVVGAVGSAIATGGASLPISLSVFAGTSAAPVVGQIYNESLAELEELRPGHPGNLRLAENEATIGGGITAITSLAPGVAILRKVPGGDAILRGAVSRVAGRLGMAAVAEGTQEYTEGVLQELVAETYRRGNPEIMLELVDASRIANGLPPLGNADMDKLKGLLLSPERFLEAIIGAILGGGARAALEAGGFVDPAAEIAAFQTPDERTLNRLAEDVVVPSVLDAMLGEEGPAREPTLPLFEPEPTIDRAAAPVTPEPTIDRAAAPVTPEQLSEAAGQDAPVTLGARLADRSGATRFIQDDLGLTSESMRTKGYKSRTPGELGKKIAKAQRKALTSGDGTWPTRAGADKLTDEHRAQRVSHKTDEERDGLHDEIVEQMVTQPTLRNEEDYALGKGGFMPENPRQDRVATIITGPPAAGKSTWGFNLAENTGAAVVDSDWIKRTLPEFKSGGGNAVHNESGEIRAQVLVRLAEDGTNLVVPVVGAVPGQLQFTRENLEGLGYTVHLVTIHLDKAETTRRALKRFDLNDRYVSLDFVFDTVGNGPLETYHTEKDGFASASLYNNDTPGFDLPQFVESADGSPSIEPGRPFAVPEPARDRGGRGRGGPGDGRSNQASAGSPGPQTAIPGSAIPAPGSEQSTEEIALAAIRLADGQIFTGETHGHAFLAAQDAGAIPTNEDGTPNLEGADLDLFQTNQGRLVDRGEASAGFDIHQAEEIRGAVEPDTAIGNRGEAFAAGEVDANVKKLGDEFVELTDQFRRGEGTPEADARISEIRQIARDFFDVDSMEEVTGSEAEKPTLAAIRTADGQVFEATSHARALLLAKEAGAIQENPDGSLNLDGVDLNLFRTNIGRLVDRLEANKLEVPKSQLPLASESLDRTPEREVRRDLEQLNADQLRADAKAAGLPTTGTKSTLIERLASRTPDQGVTPEDIERNPPKTLQPGRQGALRLAGDRTVPVTYAVVEAEELQASHLPGQGFAVNPRGDRNERPYEDPVEGKGPRGTVQKIAANPIPDLLLTDSPTPVDGPPIVSQNDRAELAVLGGNARTMGLQLAYERGTGEGYRAALVQGAQRFGLDPEVIGNMARPILVRVLSEEDAGQRGDISRLLNEGLTTGRTETADAVGRAERLASSLGEVARALSTFDTLRAALGSPAAARRIVQAFVHSGAFTDRDVSELTVDGLPNQRGKNVIEQTILAAAVPDLAALSKATPAAKAVLLRAAPALVAIRRAATAPGEKAIGFALDRTMAGALEAIAAFKAAPELAKRGAAQFREWASGDQTALGFVSEDFRSDHPSLALAYSILFDTPTRAVEKLRSYAQHAEDATSGQLGLLTGGEPLSGMEAFWDTWLDPAGEAMNEQLEGEMGAATLYSNPVGPIFGYFFKIAAVTEDSLNKLIVKLGGAINTSTRAVMTAAGTLTPIGKINAAMVAWMTHSELGQVTTNYLKLARDQVIPLSKTVPEAASLIKEAKIKDSYGRLVGMEFGKLMSGVSRSSRVLGFTIPRKLATKANRELMFKALTDENFDIETLPEPLIPLVRSARKTITRLGQAAVDAGLLRQDTFDRNKLAYLPRLYRENELAQQGLRGISRKFKIQGDRFKPRLSDAWAILDSRGRPINRGKGETFRYEDEAARDEGFEKLVSAKLIEWVNSAQRAGTVFWRTSSRRNMTDGEVEEAQDLENEIKGQLADMDKGDPSRKDLQKDLASVRRDLKEGKIASGVPSQSVSVKAPPAITEGDLYGPRFDALPDALQLAIEGVRTKIASQYTMNDPLDPESLRAKGLIEEAGYPVAKAILQLNHDIQMAEMFKSIGAVPLLTADDNTPGYTQLPTDPRFGVLSGRWVPDTLHRELNEMRALPHVALEIYDAALRLWKKGKTVYNPATHGRNILGNTIFADLAGIPVWDPRNAQWYAKAVQALRAKDPETQAIFRELNELGVIGADIVSIELGNILETVDTQSILKNPDRPFDWIWALASLRAVRRGTTSLYRLEDEIFKVASYLKQRQGGMTPTEAAIHTRRWFPYYDQIPNSFLIRTAARRGFMPFASFYYEAMRIAANGMREKPVTMAKLTMLPSLVSAVSLTMLGIDDEDWESVKKDMRGKIGDWPLWSALMPFRDDQGRLVQWDVTNVVPYADLLGKRIDRGDREPHWTQRMMQKIMLGNPIVNLGVGISTNEDPFFGRRLHHTGMSDAEKSAEIGKFTGKVLLPPLTPVLGQSWRVMDTSKIPRGTLVKRDPTQVRLRGLAGIDLRYAGPSLYRLVDEFLVENQVLPAPQIDDSTSVSRAKGRLYDGIIQRDAQALAEAMLDLEDLGQPQRSLVKLRRAIKTKHPLKRIRGKDRFRFLGQLHKEERASVDRSIQEFERVQEDLPELFREAMTIIIEERLEVVQPTPAG